MYTGYIRWCSTMVPYFSEWWLQQFWYTQYIPPILPMPVVYDVDVEWIMYRNSIQSLQIRLHPVVYPYLCVEGYLHWYIEYFILR